MFLVKNREFYIADGNVFQIDVSFNLSDEDYKKGYYLVISEMITFTPKNKKDESEFDIQIEKKYSQKLIQLLHETEEESNEILKNCLFMKESALNSIIEKSTILIREHIALKEDCTVNYSVNGILKKPTETFVAINRLRRLYKEELIKTNKSLSDSSASFGELLVKKDKLFNKEEHNFTPVNVSSFSFDNVAGLKEVKEELEQVVDYIKNPQKYKSMGAELQKGILMYGPPGTGKTLLAKALAGETNSKFFEVSGSEFVEKYVGVGAKRVRDLFKTAKKEAPSIIFIDEIDAIGSARNPEKEGEHNKTLNQLLIELDGFEPNDDVLVLAATNRLDTLDNALIRAGRLGEHLYVGNPDYETRKELFKIHSANKPIEDSLDLNIFAKKTHGFNGADIKSICNNAALFAIKDNATKINFNHFEKAIDKVVIGLHSKTRKMVDEEKKIVAYHESGHALLNSMLSLDKVEKVSILPRGESLGLVYKLPNEDKYLYTKKQLEDKIKILLAGRVAEEVFLGEVTNGASNDLKKATSIALRMVREYGMDDAKKLLTSTEDKISLDDKDRAGLLLNKCYSECMDIVKTNKDVIDAIATKLLDVEEIDGEELSLIISENTKNTSNKNAEDLLTFLNEDF